MDQPGRESSGQKQQPELTPRPGAGARPDGGPCSRPQESVTAATCSVEAGQRAKPRTPRLSQSKVEEPDSPERNVTQPSSQREPETTRLPSDTAAAKATGHENREEPAKIPEALLLGQKQVPWQGRQRQRESKERTETSMGEPWKRKRQMEELTMMDQETWRRFMQELSQACSQNVAGLGVCVRHALLHAPSDWGGAAREQNRIATAVLWGLALDQQQEKKLHNDLLPLPINLSDEDVAWNQRARHPLSVVQEDGAEARVANSRA